jgi:hypothetical protein
MVWKPPKLAHEVVNITQRLSVNIFPPQRKQSACSPKPPSPSPSRELKERPPFDYTGFLPIQVN